MQVFLVGTPFETAKELDKKRLNKQIIECGQILSAIEGTSKAWKSHPVVEMYKSETNFLRHYKKTLELYRYGQINEAIKESEIAMQYKPIFFCDYLINKMKQRLYTKDKIFYKKWAEFGESDINIYFVNYCWKHYSNGKLIKIEPIGEINHTSRINLFGQKIEIENNDITIKE